MVSHFGTLSADVAYLREVRINMSIFNLMQDTKVICFLVFNGEASSFPIS